MYKHNYVIFHLKNNNAYISLLVLNSIISNFLLVLILYLMNQIIVNRKSNFLILLIAIGGFIFFIYREKKLFKYIKSNTFNELSLQFFRKSDKNKDKQEVLSNLKQIDAINNDVQRSLLYFCHVDILLNISLLFSFIVNPSAIKVYILLGTIAASIAINMVSSMKELLKHFLYFLSITIFAIGLFTSFMEYKLNNMYLNEFITEICLVLFLIVLFSYSFKKIVLFQNTNRKLNAYLNGFPSNKKEVIACKFKLKSDKLVYTHNSDKIKIPNFSCINGQVIGMEIDKHLDRSFVGELLSGMFYYQGELSLNNVDLAHVEDNSLTSILLEEDDLYDFSMKENISLNNKGDLKKALETCELSDGTYNLETIINADSDISYTLKMKVLIARALYGESKIIVLTMPFEHLEEELSKRIISNIKDKYKNSIVFIVSEKKSILDQCDTILKIG